MAQLGSLLLATLSELIRSELKDPRLPDLTLTDIRLARDLASCNVKVSTLGDASATAACCALLNKAAPLLWNRLRTELKLRQIPHLHFAPDFGGLYVEEIGKLLAELPPAAEEPLTLVDAPAPAAGGGEDE